MRYYSSRHKRGSFCGVFCSRSMTNNAPNCSRVVPSYSIVHSECIHVCSSLPLSLFPAYLPAFDPPLFMSTYKHAVSLLHLPPSSFYLLPPPPSSHLSPPLSSLPSFSSLLSPPSIHILNVYRSQVLSNSYWIPTSGPWMGFRCVCVRACVCVRMCVWCVVFVLVCFIFLSICSLCSLLLFAYPLTPFLPLLFLLLPPLSPRLSPPTPPLSPPPPLPPPPPPPALLGACAEGVGLLWASFPVTAQQTGQSQRRWTHFLAMG